MPRFTEKFVASRLKELTALVEKREKSPDAHGLDWGGLVSLVDEGIKKLKSKEKTDVKNV